MQAPLTIIDFFEVTAELAPRLDGLALGRWHVLQGNFASTAELPSAGSCVVIHEPDGQRIQVVVSGCEVRHGTAAISFAELNTTTFPRLSVIYRLNPQ